LDFRAKKGKMLEISGNDYDLSVGANDSLGIESSKGKAFAIGAQGKRLIKILESVNSLDITFSLSGQATAMLIKETAPDEDKPKVTLVVMPIYIDD
jgi:DNA polymerase III sliding clamp (beta) subunit (PCNA family)